MIWVFAGVAASSTLFAYHFGRYMGLVSAYKMFSNLTELGIIQFSLKDVVLNEKVKRLMQKAKEINI